MDDPPVTDRQQALRAPIGAAVVRLLLGLSIPILAGVDLFVRDAEVPLEVYAGIALLAGGSEIAERFKGRT